MRVATFALLLLALALGAGTLSAQEGEEATDLDTLLSQLYSEEPTEQQETLERLIELGETAAPSLEAYATDPTTPPRIRSGAAYALGQIGAASSRPVLDQLWEEGIENLTGGVAIQVAVALAEYEDYSPLTEILAFGDEVLAAKAAVQLGLREVESAIPDLIAAWENENLERMQPFFAIALGLLGDDRGQELLQAYLRTPEIRNHAAVALAGIGQGEAALFELEFALDDPDPLVRFHAIRALALIGPSRIEEHLRRMSEDPDENVAAYAARELLRLQRRGRSPR